MDLLRCRMHNSSVYPTTWISCVAECTTLHLPDAVTLSLSVLPREREKLLAGLGILFEHSQHHTGYSPAVYLLHASHHHAHVSCFHHHCNACWLQCLRDGCGNLFG